MITNDQANGLVDSALANGGSFAMHEIGGGCFCCRSESLVEALNGFSEKVQPDVVIGEPVGSCTDLVSTVLEPLRTIYKTDYVLAPLSVMVDPFRAGRLLTGSGGNGSAGFSKDVEYIFLKQLEEAEMIVVNKCDLFPKARLDELCEELARRYPQAEVLRVSARTGEGLEEWWELLMTRTHSAERLMDVDYEVYAEGEARLGWVNGEYAVGLDRALRKGAKGVTAINGNRLLEMIAGSIRESFRADGIEVAHLKISLEAEGGGENIQRPSSNIQHPTSNIQHPTSNG